ncbi:MAG: IS66 family transposase, partial [Halomonas sp.]|nr:IS66 family transposase [Halomonas sp.]
YHVLLREVIVTVLLVNPDVEPVNKQLLRFLRSLPLGHIMWLFGWTDLGADHLGIFQSLSSTC